MSDSKPGALLQYKNWKESPNVYAEPTHEDWLAEIQRLQRELAEKFSGKCYWCGDIKAGFYHVECAQKMSTGNVEEYKKVVLSLQDTLESTRKKLDEAVKRLKYYAMGNYDMGIKAGKALTKIKGGT